MSFPCTHTTYPLFLFSPPPVPPLSISCTGTLYPLYFYYLFFIFPLSIPCTSIIYLLYLCYSSPVPILPTPRTSTLYLLYRYCQSPVFLLSICPLLQIDCKGSVNIGTMQYKLHYFRIISLFCKVHIAKCSSISALLYLNGALYI